jgi:hypothetical protein
MLEVDFKQLGISPSMQCTLLVLSFMNPILYIQYAHRHMHAQHVRARSFQTGAI